MSGMEGEVLRLLGEGEVADTWVLAQSKGWDHLALVGVVKSLSTDYFASTSDLQVKFYTLTDEASACLSAGMSPELALLTAVPEAGMPMAEAKGNKAGFSKCMKNKWLTKEGAVIKRKLQPEEVRDELLLLLRKLKAADCAEGALSGAEAKELKRRNMVKLVVRKSFQVAKGAKWAPVRTKASADLTTDMLNSGAWAQATFKPYNFNSLGQPVAGGYLHPLLKVRMEFRKILIGMGFEEMPTNKWVESSFWNFDSLFQPQQHPARDAHDTFFLKTPAQCSLASVPSDYVEKVKKMHEEGGFGSIGYRYDWSLDEAKKNILRTHTTAVSSQMLYKLANQEGGFKPAKYFSVDRVFRNETMDATHLAEFHQVEGLVADRNLSLGDLIGTIKTFFDAIGLTQLRFKPAFNPYTEPSMEIFAFHPDLGKWIELGNSGMFRPEMIRPMGLPADVRVIAWGLALERPTMIKYRVKNIRELFGHKINLEKTKTAALSRFP